MPPRNNSTPREPRERTSYAPCLKKGHEYLNLSIEGHPEIVARIMDFVADMDPMMVLGRGGGALTASRDKPEYVGMRYTYFVFNMQNFREKYPPADAGTDDEDD